MMPAKKAASGGAPAWMVTFADLMSLLLTLFVLLLSFASMETERFKELAGSLRGSFGFQQEVGILGVIQLGGTADPVDTIELSRIERPPLPEEEIDIEEEGIPDESLAAENLETLNRITSEMSEEIDSALIDVIATGDVVIVRFPDQVSFISGSGDLISQFFPVMAKVAAILETEKGHIVISGHTDDVPIRTDRYRSNWDLSSARAVSVAHYILEHTTIDPGRITVQGFSDSRPLVPNTNSLNRAQNRRVEIMIQRADGQGDGGAPENGAD